MTQSEELKYSYFPGCSLESSAVDYNRTTVGTFRKLGIELQELDDWNCCGTSAVASVNTLLSYLLPARNLALAAEQGLELAVACNGCFGALRRASLVLEQDLSPLGTRVRDALEKIGRSIEQPVPIRHVLNILAEDLGFERLRKHVVRPLTGLRVVPYYGCQFSRPGMDLEEAETPQVLDRLLTVLGAEVLEFHHKTKCCGGVLMTVKPEAALSMVQELLEEAAHRGADLIAVTCPLCQLNLDVYQQDVNRRFGTDYALPVPYFSQLLGLALGMEFGDLELDRGFVSSETVLSKYA